MSEQEIPKRLRRRNSETPVQKRSIVEIARELTLSSLDRQPLDHFRQSIEWMGFLLKLETEYQPLIAGDPAGNLVMWSHVRQSLTQSSLNAFLKGEPNWATRLPKLRKFQKHFDLAPEFIALLAVVERERQHQIVPFSFPLTDEEQEVVRRSRKELSEEIMEALKAVLDSQNWPISTSLLTHDHLFFTLTEATARVKQSRADLQSRLGLSDPQANRDLLTEVQQNDLRAFFEHRVLRLPIKDSHVIAKLSSSGQRGAFTTTPSTWRSKRAHHVLTKVMGDLRARPVNRPASEAPLGLPIREHLDRLDWIQEEEE